MLIPLIKRYKAKDSAGFTGKMRITVRDSITGEIISQSKWMKNKIVSSSGYGRNIIMRQLTSDTTYPIPVDSAIIGTGSTAPTDADIALVAQVASFSITDKTVSNDQATFSIFMTDALLPNGTYAEFGLKMGSRLFSRVLISPTFTKSSNQNTTIDYIIQLT
jgi:hypothetical protein